MGKEFWFTVEEVLNAALARTGPERRAFLAGVADQAVRAEVESLLDADGISDGRIASAFGAAAATVGEMMVRAPERFHILRQVGQGGMGIVFEAVDRERNLRVALKFLTKVSPVHLYAFKQEFRSLAGLLHRNVVKLYELLQDREDYYLSLEFIEGVGFADYVRAPAEVGGSQSRGGLTVSPDRLCEVMRQVAAGLQAIHDAGKLHRDLKPSNVMVEHGGRAVILDFGLVTELEQERFGARTALLRGGTASYMSPEHLHGTLSLASDWYSFGVMLFEALTGASPFEEESSGIATERKRRDGPSPRELIGEQCPEELDRLCQSLLRLDPAARPSGTKVLEVLGQPNATPMRPEQAVPFVGRDGPLRLLGKAFDDLRAGQATVVLLSGPAGTGKTSLVERFLKTAGRVPGTLVLTGRCFERDGVPYKGLDSVIDQMSRFLSTLSPLRRESLMGDSAAALSCLFPVLASIMSSAGAPSSRLIDTDRAELRRTAFHAFRQMVGRITSEWRLILWLDDLQWGDHDGAELMLDLLRGPNPPILLLLCSYRSGVPGSLHLALEMFIEAVEREPIAKVRMQLTPLETADAALLAESILRGMGEDSRERALTIARDSGGVPLFIRELARAKGASGGAATLEGLIWARVAELDEEPRRVLFLTAIAGRPVTQAVVFKAASITSRNPATLDILTNASLLCSEGSGPTDTLATFHDRIRETIVAQLERSEKGRLHRRLAEVLESSGQNDDPELLAYHLEAGGDLRRAGFWYHQAAERAAAAVAFEKAAELYGRVMALCELPPMERAEVELKRADMLANAGRSADAAEHYFAAGAHLAPDRRLYVEGLAAYHLCVAGHLAEGRSHIDSLLRRIGRRPLKPGAETIAALLWRDWRCRLRGNRPLVAPTEHAPDRVLLAQIDMLWFAAAGLGTSDLVGGFCLLLLSMELAQKAREPMRMIRAYAWHAGMQVARQRRLRQAAETFELCRQLSRRIGDPPASRAILALTSALRHYHLGSWAEALPCSVEAERIITGECRGLNWELAFARALKLTLRMNLGEVQRLTQEAGAIVEHARLRGDLATAITIASFPLPYGQIVEGRPAAARETWRHWLAQWPHREGSHQEAYGALIDIWSYLYEGDAEAAFAVLGERWDRAILPSGMLRLPAASVYFWETRARVLLDQARVSRGGQRRDLTREVEAIAARLRRCPAVHAPAHVAQLGAALEALHGNLPRAIDRLAQAKTIFEANQMKVHAFAAQLRMREWGGGTADAEHLMRCCGIADPRAVTRMHVNEC